MLPLIRRYIIYTRPIRGTALLALLATLASPLLGAAILNLTAALTDQVFVRRRFELLTVFLVAYAAAVMARAALGFLRSFLDTWNLERISQEVRCGVYERLLDLGEEGIGRASVGEMISTLSSDSERIGYLVYSGPIGLIAKCVSAVVYGVFMFMLNWKLTLCALLIAPVLGLINMRTAPYQRRMSRVIRRLRARTSGLVEERLNALRLVREYQSHDREAAFYRRRTGQIRRGEIRSVIMQARIGATSQLVTLFGGIGIMWLGAIEIQAGHLSVGALIAFIGSIGSLQGPLTGMARSVTRFARARASAERLEAVIDQAPRLIQKPDARPLRPGPGAIEMQRVSFGYPGRPQLLSEVSLTIEAGETVALVGASGAGKTTIASLLCRRRDPTHGSVLIDGHDLRDATFDSIARAIRVVDQDPVLLRAPVLDNVRYGNPGATLDEVERAIAAAGGEQLVRSLPNGLATSVGARGGRLSGGQRQRIALARALLTDCRILLLDEATAAVDSETEAVVRDALGMGGERTTILISHRLSSVRHADRVFVLDGGRIVEAGTADRLLAAGGRFAELFADQAQPQLRAA